MLKAAPKTPEQPSRSRRTNNISKSSARKKLPLDDDFENIENRVVEDVGQTSAKPPSTPTRQAASIAEDADTPAKVSSGKKLAVSKNNTKLKFGTGPRKVTLPEVQAMYKVNTLDRSVFLPTTNRNTVPGRE
jgi:hypothetical protein